MNPDIKAKVILADPPWSYSNFTDIRNGSAAGAIVVQSDQFIEDIPVESWTHDDCILILWATWPKLREAQATAEAWGFKEYVTGIPWVKTIPSTGNIKNTIGFWSFGVSEYILVYRKGKPKRNRKAIAQVYGLLSAGDVFYSPPSRPVHSSKPTGIHEWIEGPLDGPYLELFAREKREGWECWGYDIGQELGPHGVREIECVPTEPRRSIERAKLEDSDQGLFFG